MVLDRPPRGASVLEVFAFRPLAFPHDVRVADGGALPVSLGYAVEQQVQLAVQFQVDCAVLNVPLQCGPCHIPAFPDADKPVCRGSAGVGLPRVQVKALGDGRLK